MTAAAPRTSRRQSYSCECRHRLQAFGSGRHRRYYEVDDTHWARPLMAKSCPDCKRPLPTSRRLVTS